MSAVFTAGAFGNAAGPGSRGRSDDPPASATCGRTAEHATRPAYDLVGGRIRSAGRDFEADDGRVRHGGFVVAAGSGAPPPAVSAAPW
jgi:hypothetical protein